MTLSDNRSDYELLGDTRDPRGAFAVFYRRHVEAVFRFVASRGADADVAADTVSETFLAALTQRRRFDGRSQDARLWLLGIAARKLVDRHRQVVGDRHRAASMRTVIELTARDRSTYELAVENSGHALQYLGDLPQPQQDAIRQRVLSDREYADIASDLGLSEQAARKNVSRGLARLRTQLGRNR